MLKAQGEALIGKVRDPYGATAFRASIHACSPDAVIAEESSILCRR